MNKITKLALGLSYPQDKISALLEIVNATPNPVMATEILLGVHEKVKLASKVKASNGNIRVLKEANEWTDTVSYGYLKPKRIGSYYPKGTDAKLLNDSNWEKLKAKSSDENTEYLYFNSEIMEEQTSSCSFKEWLECEDISPKKKAEFDIYSE
jgi:hypothetical protein